MTVTVKVTDFEAQNVSGFSEYLHQNHPTVGFTPRHNWKIVERVDRAIKIPTTLAPKIFINELKKNAEV